MSASKKVNANCVSAPSTAPDVSDDDQPDLQAWIDVGGTFTDCFVSTHRERLSGVRRKIKVLSSGLVPVSCASGSYTDAIVAPELAADSADFWRGARLRCFDGSSKLLAEPNIIGYDADRMQLKLSGPVRDATTFEIDSGLEAPVLAVRRLLGCALLQPLPAITVRLGTTRGTNALLTRRGARTALAITTAFEDLLLIGDQTRPQLFDLSIRPEQPLAEITIGICERLDARGHVLVELDEEKAQADFKAASEAGCTSLALCLLHSYCNPSHEVRLEQLARDAGFQHISRSSALAPLIEIVARAQTTVIDAYLGPIVRSYLERLADQFGGSKQVKLQVMTSAGGLVNWQDMAGKDSILSGPAGGVVALRALSTAAGEPLLIGLDMGGTSTDACRTAPGQTLQYESTKAGVRILTPTLPIETVASGGGSICWFDGVSLRVGPQSAGAVPGPACYGRGGPLTITDLNVFLGRLPTSQFPFPIDTAAAQQRLMELDLQLKSADTDFDSLEKLADGLRAIANQQMAEAVRTISIAQGADPRAHALVGFGGAAGQHICEIAELLGVDRIIDTAEAGLLSALGMGLASERHDGTLPVYQALPDVQLQALHTEVGTLVEKLALNWTSPSARPSAASLESQAWLELRYQGTDVAIAVEWPRPTSTDKASMHAADASERAELITSFEIEHRKRFGYARQGRTIELVAVRVEVTRRAGAALPPVEVEAIGECRALDLQTNCQIWLDDRWQAAELCPRADLTSGTLLSGPAIVLSAGSTLVIATKWVARTASDGTLIIQRSSVIADNEQPREVSQSKREGSEAKSKAESSGCTTMQTCETGSSSDPIAEAVFAQRLAAIATQMGTVLQQTALSVNVKQRRDFSCAVFDRHGRMLASAPHVPVHLGAMGATVRAAMRRFPDLARGDVVVTNNPYEGGSHLPDVTVISGVYAAGGDEPRMFVANRAHHADIGGIAPGSMSVSAKRLGDEGAIIEPLRLRAQECDELAPVRAVLTSAQWPPRNIGENLADLRAQLAANARGADLIAELAEHFSWPKVQQLASAVLTIAERRVRNFVRGLSRERRQFTDHLDDGTLICVTIMSDEHGKLLIDFAGTGDTSQMNFNANPSIVTAAVIYVLRCLIADDLPLNEGMLAAIDLRIPIGVLNPTAAAQITDSPAVAAGNVETSQRVVDVLLGAFDVAAASQGTMNNFLFGNSGFGFYETICGGAGATHGCTGASGVHTHMTNTRLTDPEILETKYPARLLNFGLRKRSGGSGKWQGGDGVVRTILFLEPVSVSLLTSRRGEAKPYGARGGQPGSPGVNTRISREGVRTELPAACTLQLDAGEAIEIQTPGGGGFGTA